MRNMYQHIKALCDQLLNTTFNKYLLGLRIRTDGTTVNIADGVNPDGSVNVVYKFQEILAAGVLVLVADATSTALPACAGCSSVFFTINRVTGVYRTGGNLRWGNADAQVIPCEVGEKVVVKVKDSSTLHFKGNLNDEVSYVIFG